MGCCTSRGKDDVMSQTGEFSGESGAVDNSKAWSDAVSESCLAEDPASPKVSSDQITAIWPSKLAPGLPCRRLRFADAPDKVVEYTIEDDVSDDGGSTNSAVDAEDLCGSGDMVDVFGSSISGSDDSADSASDDEDCIIAPQLPGQADAFLEVVARVWELELQEKQIFKEWDKREETRQQLAAGGGCVATTMPQTHALEVAIDAVPALSHVRRFSHSRSRSVAQPVPL
jgi:hypothetical protein